MADEEVLSGEDEDETRAEHEDRPQDRPDEPEVAEAEAEIEAAAGEEEPEEDSRLSAEARAETDEEHAVEGETAEERRLRNQENRRRKKEARIRDRQERDELRQVVGSLTQRLTAAEQRSVANELDALDARIQEAASVIQQAEAVMASAEAAGKAIDYTKAKDIKDAAIARGNQLIARKNQLSSPAREARPQAGAPQPNKTIAEHGRKFAQANPWFDWGAGDEDSAIVYAIDATIKREGYDPNDADYWAELQSRVKERLPGRFREQRVKETKQKQRSSPVSAGRSDSAPASRKEAGQIRFSEQERRTLEEAGYWGDAEKMKSMRKRWDEQRRAQQAS